VSLFGSLPSERFLPRRAILTFREGTLEGGGSGAMVRLGESSV
jgi:hypothetical protein